MQPIDQEEFWRHYQRFLKNNLTTELPNPRTHNLSQLCQSNLRDAFTLFKQVELDAITALSKYIPAIKQLQQDIRNTLSMGGRIFLIGCGASGRLATLLKRLWEEYNKDKPQQVISISAGGDISLIKSVEQFEDKPQLGIQQLLFQGFKENDLLIGLSASGESPFILAAVEHAAAYSRHKPYLVFNNAKADILERNTRHPLANSSVYGLELNVGPMALTGSTRLQATTAMHIALGIALCKPLVSIKDELDYISEQVKNFPLEEMAPITSQETSLIADKQYILYQTNDMFLGLSLLADTTERSPTFNLPPYESSLEKTQLNSPFYLNLPNFSTAKEAWKSLLNHEPTCLDWPQFPATDKEYIYSFDLSASSPRATGNYLPGNQYLAKWQIEDNNKLGQPLQLSITLDKQKAAFLIPADHLAATIVYKLCLNSHSTLMMGRLGYFSGNLMISLKPSNYKLVDRAIRYASFILEYEHGINLGYKEVAEILFQEIEKLQPNQSIVQNVVNRILNG